MKPQTCFVLFSAILAVAWETSLRGMVSVTPTMDTSALAAALRPQGLTINAVTIERGASGQFGTYINFNNGPVRITNGVVLSTGEVAYVGDPPDPDLYGPEPNWFMDGFGSPEFETYGLAHI